MMRPLALLTVIALLTMHAHAELLPVDNAGFEADPADPNTFPVGPVTDWTVYDPNGIFGGGNVVGVINPTGSTFFPAGAPEGNNAALIFVPNDIGNGPIGLSQVLADTLQPNTRYTLTVEVGNIASGTGAPPFDEFGFFNLNGFPGYAVQLLAGGVVIEQDNNTLFGSIAEGTFATSTVVADIPGAHPQLGQALEIRLVNLNTDDPTSPDPGIEVDFDDVRLDASVPESASSTVLLVAALALVVERSPRYSRKARTNEPAVRVS